MDVDSMLVLGFDRPSSEILLELIDRYPQVYGAVGCHPEDSKLYDTKMSSRLKELLNHDKMVAVGEIGLDYHCDVDHDLQKKVFIQQLRLARSLQLPVSVHNRDAFEDCYSILKEFHVGEFGGIMHSFNGEPRWAQKFIDLGMDLSYSGVVTFKNATEVQEAAKKTPLENLLVETDAPYLTPVPYRGQQNEPAMTRYTVEFIAQLKKMSGQEVAQATYQNTKRVLHIHD